ncbi:MAG TPA: GlsB/YeaQ/YmgE family stress response membrane protein [Gammaproteobacteria bacterium]|nr:GlsB/YeaQ/YmgE family stress response membrane protein [Gammaproteobacteria bacterium]
MDILITLIIGGVIGWVASLIMKTDAQMGIIANVVVGIVGSFLGFWVAGLLGIAAGGAIVRWAIGIGGAVLLIVILRALKIVK